MSFSKQPPSVPAEPPKQLCTRCRKHGVINPVKGHRGLCPFLPCQCAKCQLITERTRTRALQRNLNKAQRKGQRPGAHTADSAEGPAAPPAAGGETESGLDSGKVLPFASSGEGPSAVPPINAPHSGDFGQGPPLPLMNLPVRMPANHPSSYVLYPNVLSNMPQFPVMPPAEPYNYHLSGPRMVPYLQPGAGRQPLPPQPRPPASPSQTSWCPGSAHIQTP